MAKFSPIKVSLNEFSLSDKQIYIIKQLGKELSVITKNIPNIKQIIVRGGFTLDTILGIEPHDIDLFYSLQTWASKKWQGCQCNLIKSEIKKLDLSIINSRKTDLGHILKGEIYQEPIDKVIGIFSHHDINSRICFDKNGDVWTCKETIKGIKSRIHEWDYDAQIQFAYYPYMEKDSYVTFYSRNIIRGLRMIYTKKYLGVGPVFRNFLAKSPYIFDEILKDKKHSWVLKKYILEKTDGMTLDDFENAIKISKYKNARKLLKRIESIIES